MTTNRKNTVESVKELLTSLTAGKKAHEDGLKVEGEQEAQTKHQAESQDQPTEQEPEQTGKAPLPPEPQEFPAEEEEDVEEEEGEDEEKEPVFTDQDSTDLTVLEGKVTHHGLEQARAIREIRQRKLWMLHRKDDGSRMYETFDKYVDEHWGHTRQWATQQTQWLATMEKLDDLRAKGADVPVRLSADAVGGLWQLDAAGGYQGSTEEEQAENGLVAVIQEAQNDGLRFSRDNLRTICDRRADYFKGKKGSHPSAASTYAAYKQDCILVNQLAKGGSFGVVKEAKNLPGDLADNLLKLCSDQRKLPRAEELMEAMTGNDLEIIIPRLNTLAQEVSDTETKKNLLKTRKAEIRAMQQGGALALLKEEVKVLQTELEQKGVIKKRGGKKKDEAGDGTLVKEPEEAGKDGAGEDAGEDEENGVKEELDTAYTNLQAAFDAEWPDAKNGDLIQAILDTAQVCEEKLAEIINKAKELLADADKPLKVSVGVLPAEKPKWTAKPLDPSDPESF